VLLSIAQSTFAKWNFMTSKSNSLCASYICFYTLAAERLFYLYDLESPHASISTQAFA